MYRRITSLTTLCMSFDGLDSTFLERFFPSTSSYSFRFSLSCATIKHCFGILKYSWDVVTRFFSPACCFKMTKIMYTKDGITPKKWEKRLYILSEFPCPSWMFLEMTGGIVLVFLREKHFLCSEKMS
jgi:hypothetical protein